MKVKLISLITFSIVFSACSLLPKPPLSPPSQSIAAEENNSKLNQRIPGGNPLELLKLPQIQTELKLSKDQINQLQTLEKKVQPQVKPPDQVDSEQKPVPAHQQKRLQEENQRLMAQLLIPEQMTRFRELVLQVYGWATISPEEFNGILALSSEQKKQIEPIRMAFQDKMKSNMEMPTNLEQCESTVKSNFEAIKEISESTETQIKSIITPEQEKVFNDLKGADFILNLEQVALLCR